MSKVIARADKRQRRFSTKVANWWDELYRGDREMLTTMAAFLVSIPSIFGFAWLGACFDVDVHFAWWMLLFLVPLTMLLGLGYSMRKAVSQGVWSGSIAGEATKFYNQLNKQNKKAAKPLLDRIYVMDAAPERDEYTKAMVERKNLIKAMLEKQRGVERQGRKISFDNSDIQAAEFYVNYMDADFKAIDTSR